ncbi:hypothetical protein [Mycobacterium sp. NAZ190054]|uniref:hypothetical protein n=1 Tax=Mycobacterium sp. NAZ190054 TaxID=1747766 RepID=UPI000AB91002|nr:hypothetical protein [Mycobacterium sp. NAZ190054]
MGDDARERLLRPVTFGHDWYPSFDAIADLHRLADRLRDADVEFVIKPYVRFKGEGGEQWTMFLRDPAGNALEFKAFADDAQVFAT